MRAPRKNSCTRWAALPNAGAAKEGIQDLPIASINMMVISIEILYSLDDMIRYLHGNQNSKNPVPAETGECRSKIQEQHRSRRMHAFAYVGICFDSHCIPQHPTSLNEPLLHGGYSSVARPTSFSDGHESCWKSLRATISSAEWASVFADSKPIRCSWNVIAFGKQPQP